MDVIFKEGILYLQGVKFGKRSWRKMRMMLFKPSSTGVGRLEIYTVTDNSLNTDQKKVSRERKSERKVVRLSDCLSVTPAVKESCPSGCTAFYLNTTQCTYTLASTTTQDWLSALCLLAFQKDPGQSDKGDFERGSGLTMEDNDLYSSWKSDLTFPSNQYPVTIQNTEASKRCRLAGEYIISTETEEMTLLSINTGHVIYSWPYRLLRKFGQVEGGFSIEAGRRCESGEGVFIFLTSRGLEIFQAISKQCSANRDPLFQPIRIHRRSLPDMPPVILPTKTQQPPGPPAYNPADVSADTEDKYANHYSTINDMSVQNAKQLSLLVGEELDYEEQRCHSLDALNMDMFKDDTIYYNLRRETPPLTRKDQFNTEREDSECIYSDLKVFDSPSNQLSFFSPLSPPCMFPKSAPNAPLPKPRNQNLPPVNSSVQAEYNTEVQAIDDMKETEEALSYPALVAPTEAPGSFKHRLAEILSKDLAKFQPPPPPYGEGSPTFFQ